MTVRICPQCGTRLDEERMMYPIPVCCQEFVQGEESSWDCWEELDIDGWVYFDDDVEDDE